MSDNVYDDVKIGPFPEPLAFWQEEAIRLFTEKCDTDGIGYARIRTAATDSTPATVTLVASVPRHQLRVLQLEK